MGYQRRVHGDSVDDSSPRNNNIRTEKGTKEDVTSRLSFWEKATVSFLVSQKRAINITLYIRLG